MSQQTDIKLLSSQDRKPIIDWATSLPSRLYSEDGRLFLVTRWSPTVKFDKIITAEIEVEVAAYKETYLRKQED